MAIGEEQDVLQDIQKAFQDGDKEESIFKAVEEPWKGNFKYLWSADWSELNGLLHFREKVYVPPDPEL